MDYLYVYAAREITSSISIYFGFFGGENLELLSQKESLYNAILSLLLITLLC